MNHVDIKPNIATPPEVRYPRAVDQFPVRENEVRGTPRWKTVLIDSLGLIAVVWSMPAAILIVALPIALVVALVTWFG